MRAKIHKIEVNKARDMALEANSCFRLPGEQHRKNSPKQDDVQTRRIIRLIKDKFNNEFEAIESKVKKLNQKIWIKSKRILSELA